MSTITTIQSSDIIANSRSDINTNFANLNADKLETAAVTTIAENAAAAATPNASASVKGITKLSTAPASATNPIAVGDNDTRVPTTGQTAALAATTTPSASNLFITQKDFQKGAEVYAADSVGTDSYAITLSPAITAYAAGMKFFVKLGTANTGAATLDVNSVGAKTIKKNYNSDLVTGDLLAGQIIQVAYDSANDCWQLLSPVSLAATTTYKTGQTSATATGTLTIAHGCGTTPKFIRIVAVCNLDGAIGSWGCYNGTTQNCSYMGSSGSSGYAYTAGNDGSYIVELRMRAGASSVVYGSASMDATNISLVLSGTWYSTTPVYFTWEAYA